jgi:hypothetical protein
VVSAGEVANEQGKKDSSIPSRDADDERSNEPDFLRKRANKQNVGGIDA